MTAELFVENCKDVVEEQLSFADDFYHAPAEVYLDFIGRLRDESVEKVLLIGHNPGLEELVENLSGVWEVMPTAAVAHFEIEAERWADVGSQFDANLKNVWRPKEVHIK